MLMWFACAQAGLDSLGAVELRRAMGLQFSMQLPATVAFDYPTPAALADCILSRLPASLTAAPPLMQVATTHSFIHSLTHSQTDIIIRSHNQFLLYLIILPASIPSVLQCMFMCSFPISGA